MRLIAFLISTLLVTFSSQAAERKPDLCIAKICLGVEAVNERSLVDSFGKGKKRLGMGDDPSIITRCFYDNTQNLWLEFTFDKHSGGAELKDIFVTNQPLCEKTFLPKKPFFKFVTKSGLMIGASEKDVIRIKGAPDRIDDAFKREKENPGYIKGTYYSSIYGEVVLVYDYEERQENEGNYFYLSDGKVKTIWLSVSE